MATKTSPTSSGIRTARTAPWTSVAATRPPTTEAAAFSGCPSTRAATPRGSLEPGRGRGGHGQRGRRPQAAGHGDVGAHRDGQPVVPGHVDGHAGRQVHGVVFEVGTLTLGPDDQAGGRLHLDLDVEVEGQGQDVEAGAEVGRRGWGPGAHAARVVPSPPRPGGSGHDRSRRQRDRWALPGCRSPGPARPPARGPIDAESVPARARRPPSGMERLRSSSPDAAPGRARPGA